MHQNLVTPGRNAKKEQPSPHAGSDAHPDSAILPNSLGFTHLPLHPIAFSAGDKSILSYIDVRLLSACISEAHNSYIR